MDKAILKELFKNLFPEESKLTDETCENGKCLFLAVNIPEVSSLLKVDLGIKKGRKNRPLITCGRKKGKYKIILLTTKRVNLGIFLEEIPIDKCKKLGCRDFFEFRDKSFRFVFLDMRTGKVRDTFFISKYHLFDETLFKFCGKCEDFDV